MKPHHIALGAGIALTLFSCSTKGTGDLVSKSFEYADLQLRTALSEIDTVKTDRMYPCTLADDGSLKLVRPYDWRSGFFPGELWYMYEYTQDEFWKEQAERYTDSLEVLRTFTGTHDLGFMLYCSYGNAYRLNPAEEYKQILLDGADALISRFNPAVGCIRSWDHGKWQFPVIIDNLMNLEYLFWAAKASGDSTYYNIAVKHADTTLKNHFREDNSSFHVVDYDPQTGLVLQRCTHQGYSDESSWSRGQAWGLYGYTMCYRETGDERYLDQAEKIAEFIMSNPNMPEDHVPYWDYDAPGIPDEPRDASASAVTASALYELSGYSSLHGSEYKDFADSILESLYESYRNPEGEVHGFLLRSSTSHKMAGIEVDAPLNYADYYFLEALLRKKNL